MRGRKLIRVTTVAISMNIIMRGQLRHMNQYLEVIGVTSYDRKHFEECQEREGVRMHAIAMARTIHPVRDIVSLWKLYSFFRRERPAIVHTHTPKAGLLGMIAAWFARVPARMHTVGGMPLVEARGVKRWLLNAAERITYACAHRVYPNSHGLRGIIIENRFCPEEKLRVLGNGGTNGIDATFFSDEHFNTQVRDRLRSEMSIGESDFVFCFVGRIAKEKGIRELVDAFSSVRETSRSRKVKLLLIGPFESTHGVLDDVIRERILQDDDIITPGRFDDVRPYYYLSDVYVFPSYREGFPNSLMEAGAMGLPSIATDINGCNEIVQHGVNGLLIEPKDANALAQAMLELVVDDAKRRKLSGNARQLVVSRFSREVVWEAMLTEYNSFLTHP